MVGRIVDLCAAGEEAALGDAISELHEHFKAHFDLEEANMLRTDFEDYDEHKGEHEAFLLRYEAVMEEGSLEEVKAAIEENSGQLIFGSSGPGAITHLTMVSAMNGLGVMDQVKHLPHEGSGPAMKSMAGGIIQFFGDTEVMMSRYDLKPLAVFADERLESMPDVPTAAEAGIAAPLNELYLWGGLFAPAGLDEGVRDQLAAACEEAVASDAFAEFADGTGTVIAYRGPEEFDEFFRAQWDANRTLIDAAGL